MIVGGRTNENIGDGGEHFSVHMDKSRSEHRRIGLPAGLGAKSGAGGGIKIGVDLAWGEFRADRAARRLYIDPCDATRIHRTILAATGKRCYVRNVGS